MNKIEQALVEHLRTEAAFRWPTEAEPEPQPIPAISASTEGWRFNAHTTQVEQGWSTSVTHGGFFYGDRMTGSQKGERLYRTERDALVALRWALCRKMAKDLRAVDCRIEAEGAAA